MIKAGAKVEIDTVEDNVPNIFGECKSRFDRKTLLLYSHFDVCPVNNIDKWCRDPFAADIIDGKIIARGTSDSKGNLVALIKAMEVISHMLNEMPLDLKFLFGGDEELGSPSLPQFIKEHQDKLNADAAIVFDATLDEGNVPALNLGRESTFTDEDEVVQAASKASEKIYKGLPTIYRSVETYPMHLISKKLKIRTLSTGCGSFRGRTHSINESITINDLCKGIKYVTAILYFLGI
jgi:acetylornithine deacetylase/succinyl-diaminopimelate desuccinylase-like protein